MRVIFVVAVLCADNLSFPFPRDYLVFCVAKTLKGAPCRSGFRRWVGVASLCQLHGSITALACASSVSLHLRQVLLPSLFIDGFALLSAHLAVVPVGLIDLSCLLIFRAVQAVFLWLRTCVERREWASWAHNARVRIKQRVWRLWNVLGGAQHAVQLSIR